MKLTTDEIRLVVFVLLALLAGAAVKHYRSTRLDPLTPARTTAPTPAAEH